MNELQVYSGIAILFVTLIHSNGFYLAEVLHLESYIGGGTYFYLADKIVHVAVPMFIFISGYKYEMKDKDKKYATLISKKFSKVIKPFLIVSMFWILYQCGDLLVKDILVNKSVNVSNLLNIFLNDTARIFLGFNYAYQLWYIPMYALIVLGYPIITKYLKESKTRLIILYIVAIIVSVVQSKTKLLASDYLNPINYIYYFYLYELGSQVCSRGLSKKYGKIVLATYLVLLSAELFIKDSFINNMCTTLILIPLSVVAWFYIATLLKNNKILLTLGKYAFPIFLFHEPIFVKETSNLLLRYKLYSSPIMIPIVSVVAIAFSICFYEIVIKTDLGKYTFDMRDSRKKEKNGATHVARGMLDNH
ncbi:acyltransferase [Clostridium bowmanii]|uniref:acyltransferase family protein n=1 Tax=Clostridium bowmanii TaxID=132925 RepID=UPI001C0E39C4|nr:acyltransferase [Clostridium bowmanii]MBU3191200.1 acyltransferase [Clostridium bowmanii]MCA1075648.1 acyltransferase [Clostridium bowmanii]